MYNVVVDLERDKTYLLSVFIHSGIYHCELWLKVVTRSNCLHFRISVVIGISHITLDTAVSAPHLIIIYSHV